MTHQDEAAATNRLRRALLAFQTAQTHLLGAHRRLKVLPQAEVDAFWKGRGRRDEADMRAAAASRGGIGVTRRPRLPEGGDDAALAAAYEAADRYSPASASSCRGWGARLRRGSCTLDQDAQHRRDEVGLVAGPAFGTTRLHWGIP